LIHDTRPLRLCIAYLCCAESDDMLKHAVSTDPWRTRSVSMTTMNEMFATLSSKFVSALVLIYNRHLSSNAQ